MASETLAFIALVEPAFRLIAKLRKIHRIQQSFGKDFIDYSNRFFDEIVVFDEIFHTPIQLLLDEETRQELVELLHQPYQLELSTVLHSTSPESPKARQVLDAIANLKDLFEKCSDLIDKYQPQDESLNYDVPPADELCKSPSDLSPKELQQSLPDEGGQSQVPVTYAINAPTRGSGKLLARIRNATSSRRRKQKESYSLENRFHGRADDAHLDHHKNLRHAQGRALQHEIPLYRRLKDWTLEDSESFRNMVHDIQQRNMFLERLLALGHIQQSSARQGNTCDTRNDGAEIQEGARSNIATLENIFDQCDRAVNVKFAVKIMRDYKDHARKSQMKNSYLGLGPDQWLIPVMALFSDSDVQRSTAPLRQDKQSVGSDMLFAIAERVQLQRTPFETWPWNPSNGMPEHSSRRPYYDKIYDAVCANNHQYTIFQRFPPNSVRQLADLQTIFTYEHFRQDSEHFSIRYYLAFLLAEFFSVHQPEDLDIRSRKIVFLLTEPFTELGCQDLTAQLRSPYLTSLDQDQEREPMRSLHDSLSLDGASVQKLGVLLNEIGCWSPVTGSEAREQISLEKAVEEAQSRPPHLLGRKYQRAMQECLNWQGPFQAVEFERKVLRHLRDLRDCYPQYSNDMY